MEGETSPLSSRPTSPDLLGYTTAGEEQAAGDTSSSSSGSSNKTVRDSPPPAARPRAGTFPQAAERQRQRLPVFRDPRGRFARRPRLGAVVLGESDDSQVGSAADLLDRSASPSWDGLGEELLENTAATRDWSTSTQHDVPLVNEVDVLSVVLEGRESAANTTMSHHDNSNAAAAAEAIEQRQDEAEELLICIKFSIFTVEKLAHTPRTAEKLGDEIKDLTSKLSKCHVFLRRQDRDNHAEDLGPRIEVTLAKMGELYEKLGELKLESGDPWEATQDARASPPTSLH